MSIGNGAPAWPSVIVSNGGISPSDHSSRREQSHTVRVSPSGRAQKAQGGRGRGGERPYWDAAAKLRSVAPVASERVAGVPSLTVRAGGGLVGACLVASSRRQAQRRSALSSASADTALLSV